MTDFAPNFTPRVEMQYTTLGRPHAMRWRIARGATVTDAEGAASKMIAFLNAFRAALFTDFSITGWNWCAEDASAFLPITPTSGSFLGGTSGLPLEAVRRTVSAKQITFTGRSLIGGPATVYLYGTSFTPEAGSGNEFRILSTESTDLAAAITALSELSPALVASDNQVVIWKAYANLKYNDHYVSKVRKGT